MSRFVSSGAIDPSSGAHVEDTGSQPPAAVRGAGKAGAEDGGKNKEAWEAVQREVEEERKRRAADKGPGEAGKSLYEILQENKAAKQAAFEEKTKLSNQFRALDDDEVEFLDEVQRSKREEEERLRRETEEDLKAFREAQRGGGTTTAETGEVVEDWGVGRKRKRREKEVRGVRRRVSSGTKEEPEGNKEHGKEDVEEPRRKSDGKQADKAKEGEGAEIARSRPVEPEKKPKLGGLVDYGSDESE